MTGPERRPGNVPKSDLDSRTGDNKLTTEVNPFLQHEVDYLNRPNASKGPIMGDSKLFNDNQDIMDGKPGEGRQLTNQNRQSTPSLQIDRATRQNSSMTTLGHRSSCRSDVETLAEDSPALNIPVRSDKITTSNGATKVPERGDASTRFDRLPADGHRHTDKTQAHASVDTLNSNISNNNGMPASRQIRAMQGNERYVKAPPRERKKTRYTRPEASEEARIQWKIERDRREEPFAQQLSRNRSRLAFSSTTTSAVSSAAPSIGGSSCPSLHISDVSSHNSSTSGYVVISGVVYDVTHFIGDHPGGRSAIVAQLGRDATRVVASSHGSITRIVNALKSHPSVKIVGHVVT